MKLVMRTIMAAATFAAIASTIPQPSIEAAIQAAASDEPTTAVKGTPDTLIAAGMRKPAPGFALTDAQGQLVSLSAYKGKVVLLDFWATWCGGCKIEIPWYMEFDKQYKKQGLAVIGVAMDDEGWKAVRPFLALKRDPETGGNTSMQYPVVLGSEGLGRQYNLTSMPMTLLIDREGRIAVSHTGMVDKANFESHIQELLR
jgi:cytochrome c biogenesis protein CcmG/thiol:disulfide interchange protein DsbE